MLYTSEIGDAEKRSRKEQIIERLRSCYTVRRSNLGGGRYDKVMEQLNNAYLVSLGTYDDGVPAFARLFTQVGGNWEDFYREVETLAEMEPGRRQLRLNELRDEQVAANRDDHGADEVQCKSEEGEREERLEDRNEEEAEPSAFR